MAKQQTKEINQDDVKDNKNMPPHICGIIMPIADIEGYPTGQVMTPTY